MLLKETIEEGNKIIAEFMNHGNVFGLYHDRWDWLMPVVEKIEALPHHPVHGGFPVYIYANVCSIQATNFRSVISSERNYAYISDPNAILDTKKESTWYNVVQFIKFYNTL